MSEEEKEAKENLDKLLADWDNEDISEIDLFILKRLIEKQQKEIEELKKEIKDITSIPDNDINYDEEGNEL